MIIFMINYYYYVFILLTLLKLLTILTLFGSPGPQTDTLTGERERGEGPRDRGTEGGREGGRGGGGG